jgi:hypothetical protein
MPKPPKIGLMLGLWMLIAVLLAACAGPAQKTGPSYVIVTLAQDTPVPQHAFTLPPTATRVPTQTLTITPSLSPTPIVGCVTQNSIYIRSGPAANATINGGLIMGNCITVLAYSADKAWAQFDGGWVFAAYLDYTHLTIDQELTIAAGATITPTLTDYPTPKK